MSTMNSKIQNCLNPSCGNDPNQFHMTAKNGPISFPYSPPTNNRYKVHNAPKELSQCRVDVTRKGDMAFNVAVFDSTGTQKGSNALSDFSNGGNYPLVLTGLPAPLRFGKLGPFQASGAGMQFVYDSNPPFYWFSSATGSSTKYLADGHYCSVLNTGTGSQDLKCYFPCTVP